MTTTTLGILNERIANSARTIENYRKEEMRRAPRATGEPKEDAEESVSPFLPKDCPQEIEFARRDMVEAAFEVQQMAMTPSEFLGYHAVQVCLLSLVSPLFLHLPFCLDNSACNGTTRNKEHPRRKDADFLSTPESFRPYSPSLTNPVPTICLTPLAQPFLHPHTHSPLQFNNLHGSRSRLLRPRGPSKIHLPHGHDLLLPPRTKPQPRRPQPALPCLRLKSQSLRMAPLYNECIRTDSREDGRADGEVRSVCEKE